MIDIQCWRARIGAFYIRAYSRSNSSQCSPLPMGVDSAADVCDILQAFISILMMVALLVCVQRNVQHFTVSQEFFSCENTTFKGTMWYGGSDQTKHSDSADCCWFVHTPNLILLLCVTNSVHLVRKLMLSGDIEMNPGPTHHEQKTTTEADKAPQPVNTEEGAEKYPLLGGGNTRAELVAEIVQALKQHADEQTTLIRNDLSTIKSDLNSVKDQCVQISMRCDSIEKEHQKVSTAVREVVADINHLHNEVALGREETAAISDNVVGLQQEMAQLKGEVERLEEYSRRENLRMFGIPHSDEKEDYETCVSAVIDTLNSVQTERKWVSDDIVRAHRIGFSKQGQPRPMIIRFTRWSDKMSILSNQDMRSKLAARDIRVANDLTRNQSSIIAEARRNGKKAFFSKGKLIVVPLDTRSYAEVAQTNAKTATHEVSATSTADDTETTRARSGGVIQGQQGTADSSEVGVTSLGHLQRRGLADSTVSPRCDVGVLLGRQKKNEFQPMRSGKSTSRDPSSSRPSQQPTHRQSGLRGYLGNATNKSPASSNNSGRSLRDRKK